MSFDSSVSYNDFPSDPVGSYFARFPSFTYIPNHDWRQLRAFYDLADHFTWSHRQKHTERLKLRALWIQAAELEFSGSSLQDYQDLCHELQIYPVPGSLEECKDRLTGVYVNIVDLVQYRRDKRMGVLDGGEGPWRFESLGGLREYSVEERKVWPWHEAKSEMLRELLKAQAGLTVTKRRVII